MRHLPSFAGVLALALAVALVGCGQADNQMGANAALTVSSVPQAEVFVDGVAVGGSGQTLALTPGEKTIEFRTDGFKTFTTKVTLAANETKTIDASLDSIDPSSPAVIAKLMAAEDVEMAPWIAPEATRGRSGKQAVAVLLWPSKDIRKNGLVNFAIEADETYGGDASLEFRNGRKVIYREKFNPESVTTVRPIPAEVLEQVKVNSKIKWGLYFEDSRHSITATFKVVRRTKVEKQLERVRKSRHMQRQPAITREIAEAVILENNRLYSEALCANLAIATAHKDSVQPYRGIVTTLRRLDAENSELFAAVAPNVSGKGQRGVTARAGGLGITAWAPVQRGALPTPTASEGGSRSSGPGTQGVTPSGGGATETPGTAAPTTPSADEGLKAGTPEQGVARLQAQLDDMRAEQGVAQEEATTAENAAHAAQAASDQAAAAAKQAEADAAAARSAYEGATQPTQAQQAAMLKAGKAAEATAEAARSAQDAAQAAEEKASALEGNVDRLSQNIDRMQSALDMASGASPKTGAEPTAKAPSEATLRGTADTAQAAADRAMTEWKKTQDALAAAEKDHATNPSATTEANLEHAANAAEAAKAEASRTKVALEKAQKALEGFSGQSQKQPVVK